MNRSVALPSAAAAESCSFFLLFVEPLIIVCCCPSVRELVGSISPKSEQEMMSLVFFFGLDLPAFFHGLLHKQVWTLEQDDLVDDDLIMMT
ncbi:Hypothetical protein NTJ_14861 [Nesidiocoris tenuis]|uniref:Uncharacterized protein n=1 Tax=Nesidiocoris tenuis TaxID=355587 RepID=A0ABN7BCD5_9HEMI|nr:Hypothetical protein NTJ_14861 [Nesidiocoris tenuis]